jgi:DNA polymerase-3 subunit alpha
MAIRDAGGAFASLGDFARRVDAKAVNKRALESLAKAGAFDALNPNRAEVSAGVEAILAMASRTSADSEQGQSSLFGTGGGAAAEDVPLPAIEPWPLMERLAAEFETVGFYLSGHPLDDYMPALKRLGVETWTSFLDKAVNKGITAARLAGTVIQRQERRSKSGNRFDFVALSDPTGQYEAICFSDTLALARDLLEPGSSVLGRFEADVDGEEVRLRLQSVEVLDAAAAQVSCGLLIVLGDAGPVPAIAAKLGNGGRSPVRLVLNGEGGRKIEIALGNRFTVTPQLKSTFKALPGVLEVLDL